MRDVFAVFPHNISYMAQNYKHLYLLNMLKSHQQEVNCLGNLIVYGIEKKLTEND